MLKVVLTDSPRKPKEWFTTEKETKSIQSNNKKDMQTDEINIQTDIEDKL